MDKLLYETLKKYHKSLSVVGYKKDLILFKILVVQFIQEMLNNEFRYFITENDIKLMQDLLYQFIGSTCEISFPTNCKCCCNTTPSNPPNKDPEEDPPVVDPPVVEAVYMYTGNQAAKPTVTEILQGSKYDYNNTKQFTTPQMTARTIWFCLPASVTLLSAENVNFSGDFIYNSSIGRNYMTVEDINIGDISYKLYYLTTIPSKNPYKVIVQ